jgi:hypothetical protein
MNGTFRVVTTSSFEREFRKLSQRNAKLLDAFEALIAILGEHPHDRSGLRPIKKLEGLKQGEGRRRIR